MHTLISRNKKKDVPPTVTTASGLEEKKQLEKFLMKLCHLAASYFFYLHLLHVLDQSKLVPYQGLAQYLPKWQRYTHFKLAVVATLNF